MPEPTPQRRPSVKDVAEHAKVSVGTVSHVLNHPEKVRAATRERVEKAMAELGFVRSNSARQLRMGTSSTVGVIVLDLANPFFTEASVGIEKRLRHDDCTMMLASSDGSPKRERELLSLYASMQVRGVILTSAYSSSPTKAESLEELISSLDIPVVLLDHPPLDNTTPCIYTDDEAGEHQAITHLLNLGHRKIGFINGPSSVRQAQSRLKGARQACTDAGFDPNSTLFTIHGSAFTAEAGAVAMKKLLDSHPEMTAVACANDLLAIGAMRSIRSQNLKIPTNIAIVGYDDIPVAAELITPLTSVRQPMYEMGWSAADFLLTGKHSPEQPFSPELVVRESTLLR